MRTSRQLWCELRVRGTRGADHYKHPGRNRMTSRITRRAVNTGIGAAVISPALAAIPASAQGAAPIKIGFAMALTGPLAANGQQALLGAQIWQEETNVTGGLLGRKIE